MAAYRKLSFKPSPDFRNIETVLKKTVTPNRIPLFELYSNVEKEIVDMVYEPQKELEYKFKDMDPRDEGMKNHIRYMYTLGYDYINVWGDNFYFPMNERPSADTHEGKRQYVISEDYTISNREDFEKYPWPDMSKVNYSRFERAGKYLPEGMKAISWTSGLLENVMWLLGYQGISYMLYDDEPLVAEIFDRVGSRFIEYFDNVASYDCVGAIAFGEDMGFNTSTMLSPEVYRKYLFPYHKKLVETVHKYGKPIILHSCGNLKEIMGDIIECGWDAKHSFEDSIEPVWKAKEIYSDKIALLGGFDMDKLARMTESEVREHTRFLIEKCTGPGWAMGTGNSVPQYIPANNFIAMIEETLSK